MLCGPGGQPRPRWGFPRAGAASALYQRPGGAARGLLYAVLGSSHACAAPRRHCLSRVGAALGINLPSRFSTARAASTRGRVLLLTPRCALGHLKPGGPKLPSTGKLVARAGPRGPCPRGSCRPPRGHWCKHGLPDPQARPGRPVPVLEWRPSLASRESAGPTSEPAAAPTAEPRHAPPTPPTRPDAVDATPGAGSTRGTPPKQRSTKKHLLRPATRLSIGRRRPRAAGCWRLHAIQLRSARRPRHQC